MTKLATGSHGQPFDAAGGIAPQRPRFRFTKLAGAATTGHFAFSWSTTMSHTIFALALTSGGLRIIKKRPIPRPVESLEISSNGAVIAATTYQDAVRAWVVRVWDISGSFDRPCELYFLPESLPGRGRPKLRLSPSGSRLAYTPGNGTIGIWDTESHSRVRTLEAGFDSVTSLAWSPDGRHLAFGGNTDTLEGAPVPHVRVLRVEGA